MGTTAWHPKEHAYGLQRISENQLNGSTWTPSFYGYDGHGNVRFLTSSAGTVTDTYQYDAFRRLIALAGNAPNSYMVQRRVVGQRRPLQPEGTVLQPSHRAVLCQRPSERRPTCL